MKKLEIERIEKIQGGWNVGGAICAAGFLAIAGLDGLGSPERYILLSIYNGSTGCSL